MNRSVSMNKTTSVTSSPSKRLKIFQQSSPVKELSKFPCLHHDYRWRNNFQFTCKKT